MKKYAFSILFVLVFAATMVIALKACDKEGTTDEQTEIKFEDIVSGTTFYTVDGEELTFNDFKGKPIVLNLWASWCPPCREEIPNFEEMYKVYGDDVQFIMMSMQDGERETPESAMYFVNENSYDLPFYFDSRQEVFYNFSVTALPMTYFISSDLLEIESYTGLITTQRLEEKIQDLIKEDDVLKDNAKQD